MSANEKVSQQHKLQGGGSWNRCGHTSGGFFVKVKRARGLAKPVSVLQRGQNSQKKSEHLDMVQKMVLALNPWEQGVLGEKAGIERCIDKLIAWNLNMGEHLYEPG